MLAETLSRPPLPACPPQLLPVTAADAFNEMGDPSGYAHPFGKPGLTHLPTTSELALTTGNQQGVRTESDPWLLALVTGVVYGVVSGSVDSLNGPQPGTVICLFGLGKTKGSHGFCNLLTGGGALR